MVDQVSGPVSNANVIYDHVVSTVAMQRLKHGSVFWQGLKQGWHMMCNAMHATAGEHACHHNQP